MWDNSVMYWCGCATTKQSLLYGWAISRTPAVPATVHSCTFCAKTLNTTTPSLYRLSVFTLMGKCWRGREEMAVGLWHGRCWLQCSPMSCEANFRRNSIKLIFTSLTKCLKRRKPFIMVTSKRKWYTILIVPPELITVVHSSREPVVHKNN